MGNSICTRPCRPHDALKHRLLPDMISNSSLFHLMGKDESLKIIDCTYTTGEQDNYYAIFMKVAIPGAQLLDINSLQNEKEREWEDGFPSKEALTVRMRRLGILPTDKVICYSQTPETVQYAARALFILKAWGYKDVRLLSGCLESWLEAEYPTIPGEIDDPFDSRSQVYDLCQKQNEYFISLQDIVYNIRRGGYKEFPQLIDAHFDRQPIIHEKYSVRKLNHIPNAFKMQIYDLIYPNGELKTPFELLEQYTQLDIKRPIICYGNTATEACLHFFALKGLGAKNVKLYDRGFQEYQKNPITLDIECYDYDHALELERRRAKFSNK